jgi:hypothetical protein
LKASEALAFSAWVPERVKPEQQHNSSNEQGARNNPEGFFQRFVGDPIAVFTFFLVVFNGGLVYVT